MLLPQPPDRKPLRLKEYDYATAGAYYITLCVQNRECLFGEVFEGEMVLNDLGRMVHMFYERISEKFPSVYCDAVVVMPNHLHCVLFIVGADPCVGPRNIFQGGHMGPPLPRILQWFKTMTTNEYIRGIKQNGWTPFEGKLWQRGYYDHIIRNDSDFFRIRDYILHNPLNWELDSENPKNATKQP